MLLQELGDRHGVLALLPSTAKWQGFALSMYLLGVAFVY